MKNDTCKFNEDIEIPEIVMQKANEAFSRIKMEEANRVVFKEVKANKINKKKRWFQNHAVAAAAIGILTIGSVTAVAAINHIWSRGMQGTLQSTDEQQRTLAEHGMAEVMSAQEHYSDLAVTAGDVTVTPETVVVDERFLYVSFSVSGYQMEKGKQPAFQYVNVYQGNSPEDSLNQFSSFYDGIMEDENGNHVYEDGSALEEDEEGSWIGHYADEKGNLEYVITAFVTDEKDSLLGKTIHVDFTNLGTYEIASVVPDIAGNWNFKIDLPAVSSAQIIQINKKVDGTDLMLENMELSPVSVKLNYCVNGEAAAADDSNGLPEFPEFRGVVLADGTRISLLSGGGMSGYTDEAKKEAFTLNSFDRVIDVEQVAALLIMPEEGSEIAEIPIQ
ncbi:MAG: DUF4179 domain-containing protein [Lachnospiraceae bacterium]|nr:DUF4179 domain-containing protein [Lachnospiraceae bacterium]